MAVARVGSPVERLVGFLGCLLLILLLTSPASADVPTKLESFGPDGSEMSSFVEISATVVDQGNGSVYVLDGAAGFLYKFDSSGAPVDFGGTALYISGNRIEGVHPNLSPSGASEIAVDPISHTIYLTEEHSVRAFREDGEPAEFSAGPGAGTNELPGLGEVFGVAIDSDGNIYVSDHAGSISIYSSAGELITSISVAHPENLVVAPDGTVYVVEADENNVGRFIPSGFPIDGSTTYIAGAPIDNRIGAFINGVGLDPSKENVYLLESDFTVSWIREYDKSGALLGSFGEPGTAAESEALGDQSQGIAIVAGGERFYIGDTHSGGAGFSRVAIFAVKPIVKGPPTIEFAGAANVTADSASLRAAINPNTAATTYAFEYGLEDCAVSACTVVPPGGGTIAPGHTPVEVSEAISGLKADTTYHFRVLAENEYGPATGMVDHQFKTQTLAAGFELSDARAWEMVSPANKHGAVLEGSAFGLVQAAADGEGIAYVSLGSIETEPGGNRAVERSTVMARRSSSGWQSKDLTPPNEQVTPIVARQTEYSLFRPDLQRGMLEPRGGTPLSPEASERTPYLWEDGSPPRYTPLVTGKEGFANVPPGTQFGGDLSKFPVVEIRGATREMSSVVIHSGVPLIAGGEAGLYLWSAHQLQPISVLPEAEGGEMTSQNAQWIGSGPGSVRQAISENGTRVFWSTGEVVGNINSLYVRDTEAGETGRLDLVQSGASGSGVPNPVFQGASSDGTVAFFTDSQQLTAGASPSGRDLYRCELPPAGADLSGGCATLTNLSQPTSAGSESADLLGLLPALDEDGTSLYFVARGVLDSEVSSHGDVAVSGQPNLYSWQEGKGTRFIATLSEGDEGVWGRESGQTIFLSASGSPDGRYFAFMSERSLTGYPNHDVGGGGATQEAFQYEASTDHLRCVSCNPSGGLPEGQVGSSRRLVDPIGQWNGRLLSASLPQPVIWERGVGPSLYQPRGVLDNGRIFFNAIDSLVPVDSNGQWDVYEFEPLGVGSCSASSGGAALVRTEGGCVSLLSSGTGEKEAGFLDASTSGNDVFFLTPAQLSPRDDDAELDLYDARVNGRSDLPLIAPGCSGEGCQSSTAPPPEATPSSSRFDGAGNVKRSTRCPMNKHKVRRKGKTRCVPRKHPEHRKHHRRGGHGRRRG